MKALRFLLACILLCSVVPVAAQETMDETTLHQHLLMAEGKPPDSYREEDRTTSTSGNYSTVEVHRGIDYRVVWNDDVLHGEYGRFEGHIWDQDSNGLTTTHELPFGNERPMPTKITIARVAQPLNAWKESTLNPQGFGRIRYVDPSTFRVLREVAVTRSGDVTTDYDDFRTVSGYTQSYHWKVDNEANKITSEGRVAAFDIRDVGDGELGIPPSKPFITFPQGQASVELPSTFAFEDVIVRVMVGDRGLDFVLDSGASGIFIDGEVAKELGLKMSLGYSRVVGGRFDTKEAIVPEMRVGDIAMHNVAIQTIPFAFDFAPLPFATGKYGHMARTSLVGLSGYDFIRSLGLTIDYAHERVTAFPAGKYVPPVMTPQSDILPIRLGDHVPEITASINGALAERVLVDTGAGGSDFMLFDYFALRYPEAVSPRVAMRLDNLRYVIHGIGGGFESKAIRLKEVDIGRYHLPNADVIQVTSVRKFQFNVDGLVGSDFLQRFTVGFDYAGGKMYLVHNEGQ